MEETLEKYARVHGLSYGAVRYRLRSGSLIGEKRRGRWYVTGEPGANRDRQRARHTQALIDRTELQTREGRDVIRRGAQRELVADLAEVARACARVASRESALRPAQRVIIARALTGSARLMDGIGKAIERGADPAVVVRAARKKQERKDSTR